MSTIKNFWVELINILLLLWMMMHTIVCVAVGIRPFGFCSGFASTWTWTWSPPTFLWKKVTLWHFVTSFIYSLTKSLHIWHHLFLFSLSISFTTVTVVVVVISTMYHSSITAPTGLSLYIPSLSASIIPPSTPSYIY